MRSFAGVGDVDFAGGDKARRCSVEGRDTRCALLGFVCFSESFGAETVLLLFMMST